MIIANNCVSDLFAGQINPCVVLGARLKSVLYPRLNYRLIPAIDIQELAHYLITLFNNFLSVFSGIAAKIPNLECIRVASHYTIIHWLYSHIK